MHYRNLSLIGLPLLLVVVLVTALAAPVGATRANPAQELPFSGVLSGAQTVGHGSPVTYDPALYTFLDVGTDRYPGGINNHGEIVYETAYGTIETTLRGDVTVPGTEDVRFPAINDHGEVVYAANVPEGGGFKLVSTVRGLMLPGTRGNLPSINNNGRVLFADGDLYITDDGTSRTLVVPGAKERNDINDAGVIVYSLYKREGNLPGSWMIMKLEPGGSPTAVAMGNGPAINNHGDILLRHPAGHLATQDGTRLTPFPIGYSLDMNDLGDVVFTTIDVNDQIRLVLATQHPQDFDLPLLEASILVNDQVELARYRHKMTKTHLTITAKFRNTSTHCFTDVRFPLRNDGWGRFDYEEVVATDAQLGGDGMLCPGETTQNIVFSVRHYGKRFGFFVNVYAVVAQNG